VSLPGLLQVLVYVVLLVAITRPMGAHLARVFADPGSGQRNFLTPVLGPVERAIYRQTAVNPQAEQGWVGYTFALLLFSVAGALVTYAIERLQNVLPFNPQGLDAVPPDLAFNTAVSFTTNTNWQNYVGETTMSYFTQMAALASPFAGARAPAGRAAAARPPAPLGRGCWTGQKIADSALRPVRLVDGLVRRESAGGQVDTAPIRAAGRQPRARQHPH
jgi:K+-transporting ATPase A subunit